MIKRELESNLFICVEKIWVPTSLSGTECGSRDPSSWEAPLSHANQPWCYAAPCRWFLHGGGSSCRPVHPGQNHPRLARGEVPDAAEQAVPHLQPRSVCSSPSMTPVKTQRFSVSAVQMFFHPSNTPCVHVPVTSLAVRLSFEPNVIALKPRSLLWQTLFGSHASALSGKKKKKSCVVTEISRLISRRWSEAIPVVS